jgi:hypothetical protein
MRIHEQPGVDSELHRNLSEPYGSGEIRRKTAIVHVRWPELQVWSE